MINYWLDRGSVIVEREVILVKNTSETKSWYDKMPSVIPVILPSKKQPSSPSEFGPKIGIAHHLKYGRHGIEGVVKIPRKYHRFSYYVLHDKINQPTDPFWVILFQNT